MSKDKAEWLDDLMSRLAGIARLVDRLSSMKTNCYSPTEGKGKAIALARQVRALIDALEDDTSTVVFDIECEHNREPAREVGPDGWPVERATWAATFESTVCSLRDLEASVLRVIDNYPNPRSRPGVPLAASALLYWRHWHDMAPPTMYDNGEAVQQLSSVLEMAGMPKDVTTCRKELARAYEVFDRHYMPAHLRYIVVGQF